MLEALISILSARHTGGSSMPENADLFLPRLFDEAQTPEGRLRLLTALSTTPLLVFAWSLDGSDFRMLTSSRGEHALPVFTQREYAVEASRRLGWALPSGDILLQTRIGSAIFNHVKALALEYVILDFGLAHSIEIDRGELERLGTEVRRSVRPEPVELETQLESISQSLRAFPEVEWAAAGSLPGSAPTLFLRLASDFRLAALREQLAMFVPSIAIEVLSSNERTRQVRDAGLVFYPWGNKAKGR